jgi:DNA-directed RNA polymerase specialized sigma24 family protein
VIAANLEDWEFYTIRKMVTGDKTAIEFFVVGVREWDARLRLLLERLEDPQLRSIALWKMEGYSTDEIADKLGCVPRTVERRLALIRTLWNQKAVS